MAITGMTPIKKSIIPGAIIFLLSVAVAGCKKDDHGVSCEGTLFGQPTSATGLDASRCKPACACKGFISKTFTEDQLNTLQSWTLTQPFGELTANPYDSAPPQKCACVCAMVIEDAAARLYRLENYPSAEAAETAGAILTHHDACGLCSTLQDFTVYAENLDIGASVKQCGLDNFSRPFDSLVSCIKGLGFTTPCAQIWAYNLRNTQAHCLQFCLHDTVYNLSDGSLNDCLACDEQYSGAVFKAVAGRTRRNTGIASGICRFCDEIEPVKHDYPF